MILGSIFLGVLPHAVWAQANCQVLPGGGGDANCAGVRICLPGVPKKLLPKIPQARPGYCGSKVDLIVMHTTHGGEQGANDLWNYFASGDRYASTQLVVGRDGSMLQMLDLFSDKSEVGHAVGGANDRSISIELNNPGNYQSRGQVPPAQYQNALRLVKTLMQTYKIPLSGVVSHGSLGGGAGDPGEGFMRDFKADLPAAQGLDGSVGFPVGTGDGTGSGTGTGRSSSVSCFTTRVGDPTGPSPTLPPECLASSGTTGSGGTTINGPVNPNATCPGRGPITCGTQSAGCHCSASYQSSVCGGSCGWCQPPDDSSRWAIDISNSLDAPVYIPKVSINGQAHDVTCRGYGNFRGSTEPNQIIEVLSCADDVTGQPIWMQFHHSKASNPLTVGATYKSGQIIGRSAAFEVLGSGPHVHFQIGVGGPCGAGGTNNCRNANEYVSC